MYTCMCICYSVLCYLYVLTYFELPFCTYCSVGTDRGSWGRYDPYVWNTTIRNCTLGPYVSAEAFDIKEGTQDTRLSSIPLMLLGLAMPTMLIHSSTLRLHELL